MEADTRTRWRGEAAAAEAAAEAGPTCRCQLAPQLEVVRGGTRPGAAASLPARVDHLWRVLHRQGISSPKRRRQTWTTRAVMLLSIHTRWVHTHARAGRHGLKSHVPTYACTQAPLTLHTAPLPKLNEGETRDVYTPPAQTGDPAHRRHLSSRGVAELPPRKRRLKRNEQEHRARRLAYGTVLSLT